MRKNHIAWRFILSKGYWVSHSQSLTANKNSGFSNKNTRGITIRHCFVLPMTSPPTDSSLCAVENKWSVIFGHTFSHYPRCPQLFARILSSSQTMVFHIQTGKLLHVLCYDFYISTSSTLKAKLSPGYCLFDEALSYIPVIFHTYLLYGLFNTTLITLFKIFHMFLLFIDWIF